MGTENGENEIMYKMAETLLEKMRERGLLSEEECILIRRLNLETFLPELAPVYP